ncbi:MAG TPA: response regulator, partial [Mucilaginibacter sp.]
LVISDMEMPDMDGVSLAQIIRAGSNPLPVILLSSIGNESKTKFPGLFAAILTKPVKQHNLYKSIRTALRRVKDEAPVHHTTGVVFSDQVASQFPLRILVAEDNTINQKVIQRILNKLGYQCDIAENGQVAIEMLAGTPYDVILMDVQMPVMDGLEATTKIRELNGRQPLIIAMTANAMPEDREMCIQNGMDDYLAKPMKPEELIKLLKKASVVLNERV